MGGIRINSKSNKGTDISTSLVSTSIDHMINRGKTLSASFIHIEPRNKYIIVRYRVGNELVLGSKLPNDAYEQILLMVKQKSNLDTKTIGKVQDGKMLSNDGSAILVNISPVIDGEKIIFDIRSQINSTMTLKELGYWGDNLYLLNKNSQAERGLIIISSQDKYGSTTALQTIASGLDFQGLTIASLGSDIENLLPKSMKIQVIDNTLPDNYADEVRLKMLVRRNPEVILISNPKNSKILTTSLSQSNSRLIIIGMLGDSATDILMRLIRVTDYHELKNLKAITGQKLCKKLCINCRETFAPSKTELKYINQYFGYLDMNRLNILERSALNEGIGSDINDLSTTVSSIKRFFRASKTGCSKCQLTGYIGNINLVEVIESDRDNLGKIMNIDNLSLSKIKDFLYSNKFISLELDGLVKCLRGILDFNDLKEIISNRTSIM